MATLTIQLMISFVASLGILLYMDHRDWHRTQKLYMEFGKNREKAFSDPKYLKNIMKEFDARTKIIGWLRYETIKSNNVVEFHFYSIVGYLTFFAFLLPFIEISVIGYLMFPLLILIFCLVIIIRRKKWKGCMALPDYFTKCAVAFFFIIIVLTGILVLAQIDERPLFNITTENLDWYMGITQIAFTFAVGLFIIITVPSLLRDVKRKEENIQKRIMEILDMDKERKINRLTKLYRTKNFSNYFKEYGDVKIIISSTKTLPYLLMIFIILGLCLLGSTLSISEGSQVVDPWIPQDALVGIISILIIVTLAAIHNIFDVQTREFRERGYILP